MSRILIGVIGPGETATTTNTRTAFALGAAIAQQGWGLLTGGRDAGVMAAASQGAHAANGLVVGILPSEDTAQMSPAVDIAICTGMGQGRNVINVLSSHVVIACGIGPGTLSEIALALKFGKPLILMDLPADLEAALVNLSSAPIAIAPTVTAAIAQTQNFLTREGSNG